MDTNSPEISTFYPRFCLNLLSQLFLLTSHIVVNILPMFNSSRHSKRFGRVLSLWWVQLKTSRLDNDGFTLGWLLEIIYLTLFWKPYFQNNKQSQNILICVLLCIGIQLQCLVFVAEVQEWLKNLPLSFPHSHRNGLPLWEIPIRN